MPKGTLDHRLNQQQAPFVTVRFAGELGECCGELYKLRAWSAIEALQAIALMHPDVDEFLRQEGSYYLFTSIDTGEELGIDVLVSAPISMLVTPLPEQGGRIGRGLLGVAALAAGVVTGNVGLIAGGVSLLGGAILNKTSPKKPVPNEKTYDDRSILYEEESQAQDSDAVPVVYGRHLVKALVLNQKNDVRDA